MKVKARHIIWLLYGLGVGAYVFDFHLSDKTDEHVEGGGKFAGMALVLLVVLVIGTALERLSERRKRNDAD